jgi:hypothetical protein
MKHITDLLRNGVAYKRSHVCAKAFQDFKDQVTKTPILTHFEPMGLIVVKTDETNFVIGAVLSLINNAQVHPIAFYCRFTSIKCVLIYMSSG